MFEGKKIAILGFGIEGKDLALYLLGKAGQITVFDRKPQKEVEIDPRFLGKIEFSCGENYLQKGLGEFDVIFRSPGIYRFIPEITRAEESGTQVLSAIKLFFELCPCQIIGVTGTKGKGTTATLIYRILKAQGKNVFLAGNIGEPYLSLLPVLTKDSIVILELSSFQLIDLDKSPQLAVVLNIAPDHLDWHKNEEEYINAKINIVRKQKDKDYALLNFDYPTPKSFEKHTKAQVFYFSRKAKVKGAYVLKGKLFFNLGPKPEEVLDTDMLTLRGKHNWENVLAACLASKLDGAENQTIKKVALSFKGLPHRLEFVGSFKGVSFYNDSFATSPLPTLAAIDSFSEPLAVIFGGSEKGLNYTKLGKEIAARNNVNAVVIVGKVGPEIVKALRLANFKKEIVEIDRSSMPEIVKTAFSKVPRGGVVLLSPAAASFDMFANYKERGNKFKEAVESLVQGG